MTKYFYDIHCHNMNMSHPNFLAFTKRFEDSFFKEADMFLKTHRLRTFLSVNILLFEFMFLKKFNYNNIMKILNKSGIGNYPDRAKNLIAVMENDAGNYFLTMEECITEHVMKNKKIIIGCNQYDKIILTPLIMDFGCQTTFYKNIHYNKRPIIKPVIEQIIDLFNGIKNYMEQSTHKIFEIYPFMGINTTNYTICEINKMLKKYFNDYTGTHHSLLSGMGSFNGDIRNLGANMYSGIKLYPPLGFDPWPIDEKEREKVMLLYDFCQAKKLPITCHISDEGFSIVSQKKMGEITSPAKWEEILSRYPKLKINLAHFGKQDDSNNWQNTVIKLIKTYDNVYSDISHRGFDDIFYSNLKNTIESTGEIMLINKLKQRILFGTDYMINLLKIDSYCKYYNIFISSKYFDENEKDFFCSTNPHSFLFNSIKSTI